MLAKAARLANEMKEISTKQSTGMTTSSKSSSGKDGIRRSLPKVINVQPNDDHTARSECSSLGYSLATATPSVFVVNGTKNTTTPTMNLLSTTIENCAEGYFLKSHQQSSSKKSNTCSVINEGPINIDHEEKKSCCDSATKPSFQIHKQVNHNSDVVRGNTGSIAENVQNMSSVDMLIQQQKSYMRSPPKVKRTSQHQLDPSGKVQPLPTNPAIQSTLLTMKSLSEEPNEASTSMLLPQQSHQRPTVLKISNNDDDYVPIADYSIRNTTTKASNATPIAVKWEKITTPSINDDDYVSLKDYSRFTKAHTTRFVTDEYKYQINASTGLSFAQKRELLIKRRRQRKRFIRRLVMLCVIITSIISYACYINGWCSHDRLSLMATVVVNSILPQPNETFPGNSNNEFAHSIEATKNEIEEAINLDAIEAEHDRIPVEECNSTVDNEYLVKDDDHHQIEESRKELLLDTKLLTSSNAVGTTTNTHTSTTVTTGHAMSGTLSFSEPSSRQRFVEDLIQSMMQ